MLDSLTALLLAHIPVQNTVLVVDVKGLRVVCPSLRVRWRLGHNGPTCSRLYPRGYAVAVCRPQLHRIPHVWGEHELIRPVKLSRAVQQ